jgi:hypothetical protein
MTVAELIAALQECDPTLQVYTFNDHDIRAIAYVDGSMDEWVHINLGAEQ